MAKTLPTHRTRFITDNLAPGVVVDKIHINEIDIEVGEGGVINVEAEISGEHFTDGQARVIQGIGRNITVAVLILLLNVAGHHKYLSEQTKKELSQQPPRK